MTDYVEYARKNSRTNMHLKFFIRQNVLPQLFKDKHGVPTLQIEEVADLRITQMSDFVIDVKTNTFTKCRYSLEDLVRAFAEKDFTKDFTNVVE